MKYIAILLNCRMAKFKRKEEDIYKKVIDASHLKKEIDKLDELIVDMKNKYLRLDK